MKPSINPDISDKDHGSDLEAMQMQMRKLRERLDTQQIVTDRLMRTAIEQGTRFSRRIFKAQSLLLVPAGVASMLFLQWHAGLPIWFVVLTVLFMATCVLIDWHITKLGVMDYGTTPLLEIQTRLTRQKRLRARRMAGGMMFLALWLPLFVYVLMYDLNTDNMSPAEIENMRQGMMTGGAIGGVIGLVFGICTYLRMQRENDRAIRQIREYSE